MCVQGVGGVSTGRVEEGDAGSEVVKIGSLEVIVLEAVDY